MAFQQVMQSKQIQGTVDRVSGITHGNVKTQTDKHSTIFPAIHQHSSHFKAIMVSWALNRPESQRRGKQTFFSDLPWSSKSTQPSLSHKPTWTWLKLPTCQHGTKRGIAFLYWCLFSMCVVKCPLTSRLRTAKCRAHKSHYTAHKKVTERNILNSFRQTLRLCRFRVWNVNVKRLLHWKPTQQPLQDVCLMTVEEPRYH